jgi:N-acetylglucosamine malate deacetylase 1
MQEHRGSVRSEKGYDSTHYPDPENGSNRLRVEDPEVNSNSRVLILAPHLEDPFIGCGGTMCKLAKRGAHVKVLFMTGSSYGRDLGPESEPVAMMTKVTDESLALLKCFESESLDLPCLDMRCDLGSKRSLFQVLDRYTPDLLFIPSLHDKNPDNAMTGMLAASALMEYTSSADIFSYKVWGGFSPNHMVEISDVIEDKRAAFRSCRLRPRSADHAISRKEASVFRSSSIHHNRPLEPFLHQKREDFVIKAWQLRTCAYLERA